MNPYELVRILGVLTDAWTAQAALDAVKRLSKRVRSRVRFTQGSPSGYSKSAGTHDGRGVVDAVIDNGTDREYLAVVKHLRSVGFAAWERPHNWDGNGGIRHVHAVLIGHPQLSASAAAQARAYTERKTNGLRNDAPDALRYHPNVRHKWRPPFFECRVDLGARGRELRAVGRTGPSHEARAKRFRGQVALARHGQIVSARRVNRHWSVTKAGTHYPTRILPKKK